MKISGIATLIIFLLVLVSLPVVAISKSDLISSYKGQSDPSSLTPTPTPASAISDHIKGTVTPAPAKVPAGTRTGTLAIDARSNDTGHVNGAKVSIDGVFKGFTPLRMPVIPIGSHQIRLSKIGFQDYTVRVTINDGKETVIVAYLVPTSGPSGIIPASVPTTIPTTVPATAPTLPSKWTFPIFPDSYSKFPDSRFAKCCGNDSRPMGPQPTPTFGSLEISSNPSGASVYLDVNPWTHEGTLIGTTPITVSVKTGSHRLKLTKQRYSGARYMTPVYDITPLYGNNEVEVTVTEGETVRVSAVLIASYNLSKGGSS